MKLVLACLLLLLGAATVNCTTNCGLQTEKVWVFGAALDFFPFTSANKGQIVGFNLDIAVMNAVCKIAGRTCKVIGIPKRECVIHVRDRTFLGRGLLDGWVDACLQYTLNEERITNGKFTIPYSEPGLSAIYVLSGNPKHLKPKPGKTIDATLGVFEGGFANTQCMNRNEMPFTNYHQSQPADLIDDLRNGVVDAIVLGSGSKIKGLKEIGKPFSCRIIGNGIITRKDSSLESWFNPAFEKLVKNGGFKSICKTVKDAGDPCLVNIRKSIHKYKKIKQH